MVFQFLAKAFLIWTSSLHIRTCYDEQLLYSPTSRTMLKVTLMLLSLNNSSKLIGISYFPVLNHSKIWQFCAGILTSKSLGSLSIGCSPARHLMGAPIPSLRPVLLRCTSAAVFVSCCFRIEQWIRWLHSLQYYFTAFYVNMQWLWRIRTSKLSIFILTMTFFNKKVRIIECLNYSTTTFFALWLL